MRVIGAALLAVALLAGCGGGYDDDIWLCFRTPEIETEALPAATVGQQYSALLTAGMARDPGDDAYEYSFTIDGHIPTGLQVLMPNRERRIQFIGIPQTNGTFTFTVSVSVRNPDGTLASCWENDARTYQIVVAPSPSGIENAP